MRLFWCAVLLLAIVGVWFVAWPSSERRDRVFNESDVARNVAEDLAGGVSSPNDLAKEPINALTQQPNAGQSSATAAATHTNTATDDASTGTPAPDIDLLGEDGVRIAPSSLVTPAAAAALPLLTDSRLPSEVVRRIDERTVELDGRFRVIGSGSESDPSRISWELLTSAKRYIDPAQGAMTAPPWVRLLDGTTVEISGYYSTALSVSSAKDLLLTLNRWDGCCIGLPPTPFDAIDISMRQPMPMRGLHLVRFGTFRGRLVIEPLAAAGFLLSLYRLEDATFETK